MGSTAWHPGYHMGKQGKARESKGKQWKAMESKGKQDSTKTTL